MRVLAVAVVLALALGFTAKDMTTGSAASPSEAWETRATEFDAQMGVSETGAEVRSWLFDALGETEPKQ
jgi:hypothetical protein